MTEIGAENGGAHELDGENRQDPGRSVSQPSPVHFVLASVCGAITALSLAVMIWLGLSHGALVCAPVTLAAAVGCAYFFVHAPRDVEFQTRPSAAATRTAEFERELAEFNNRPTLAPRRDFASASSVGAQDHAPAEPERRGAVNALEAMREPGSAADGSASNRLTVPSRIIAERLGEEQRRLTDALEIYGESIVSRLNAASVSVAREFRDAGEALNKRIETAGVAAVAGIARQAETGAAAMARAVADSEARLAEAGRDIVARIEAAAAASAQKAEAVSTSATDQWARTVAELSDVADRNLREQLDALERRRRDLSEALETESATLASRANQGVALIETRLLDAGATADRAVEAALARLEGRIESRAEAIATRLGELDREWEAGWTLRSRGLVGELTGAAAQAEAATAAATAEVARASEAAAQAAGVAFAQTAQDCARGWTESAAAAALEIGAASERSAHALAGMGETLEARFAVFEAALSASGQNVLERLDARTQALRDALDATQATVANQGGGLVASILSATGGLEAALADRSDRLQQTFDTHRDALAARTTADVEVLQGLTQAHGEAIVGALADHRATLDAALTDSAREAVGLIEASGRSLAQTFDRSSRESVTALTASAEAQRAALATRVAAAVDQIEGARTRLTGAVQAATQDADARLVAHGELTVAAVAAGVEAATRALEDQRAHFVHAAAEATQRAQAAFSEGGEQGRRALDEETARSVARLDAGRAAMAGAAGEALSRFESEIAQRLSQLGASVESASAQLSGDVALPLLAHLERIQAEGHELSTATRSLAETIANTSSAHRERLHLAFSDETGAMARILDANAAKFRAELETVVSGADEVFLSRGFDVARAIAARVEELRTLVGGDALTLIQTLEARSQDLSQQIDSVSQRSLADFERKATQLIGTLTRRGDDLLSAMAAASSESARKVVHLAEDADAHAGRATSTLREIERKVGAMLAAVDRRSAELAVDPRARRESETPAVPLRQEAGNAPARPS